MSRWDLFFYAVAQSFVRVAQLFPGLAVSSQQNLKRMEISIIIAGLMTIVILVLFLRNIMLNKRITDTAIENDRLKRENRSLEKENDELVDELDEVTGGARRHSFKSDI